MPIKYVVNYVDLKYVAMFAVLLLSLVGVGLTLGHMWSAYKNHANAQKLNRMNEMSDNIVAAAGLEAIERGVTTTALSQEGLASQDVIEKINQLRSKGDEALLKALKIAEKIAGDEPDTDFANIYKKTVEAKNAHLEARKKVDASLAKAERDIQPQEWIKTITDFIHTAARLRQAGFITAEPLQKISQDNLIVKHAVWLVSEYAGLERAVLGSIIAAQRPIPMDAMNRLQSFRSIVDLNIKEILHLKEAKDADPKIIQTIKNMEEIFLNKFNETRKVVYAVGEISGIYPITAKEWIDKSTEGINSILAVSSAITDESRGNADKVSRRAQIVFWWFILQTVVGSLISLAIIIIILKKIGRIWHLYESMDQLSTGEGDLTFRLSAEATDEIGRTASAFNNFMDKLHEIISLVKSSTEKVRANAAELSSIATQVEQGSNKQMQQADTAATATEEMSATVLEVAKNASAASSFSKNAVDTARKGEGIISSIVHEMQKISESVEGVSRIVESLGRSSDEIGKIVSLINDIADQTNLLALNAAIEAARAGEQGRGFAVVADEVRKLAERTTASTAEISRMIGTIQQDTSSAVASMNDGRKVVEAGVVLAKDAGNALKEIVEGSHKVSDMVAGIATAAEEQSTVSEEISNNVEMIAKVAKENNGAVVQITHSSNELLSLSNRLKDVVSSLRTQSSIKRLT